MQFYEQGTKRNIFVFSGRSRPKKGNSNFFALITIPFGLTFNSYTKPGTINQNFKYNGKEEQNDLDFILVDYGARMYQPDLGKFFTQDAFSEKYSELSPYQYTANNPIRYIDVNGDSIMINGVAYIYGQAYEGDD